MQTKVEVKGKFLRLYTGTLKLSEHQASIRAHNLKVLDDGRYEIVNPVDFKIGEKFEYEGHGLPKNYMGDSAIPKPTPVGPTDADESSTEGSEGGGDPALIDLTKKELVEMAKGMEIEGYKKMNKVPLVKAIESAEADLAAANEGAE